MVAKVKVKTRLGHFCYKSTQVTTNLVYEWITWKMYYLINRKSFEIDPDHLLVSWKAHGAKKNNQMSITISKKEV